MSERLAEMEQAAPEPIFALDIGTRSVIGVVAYPEGDTLRVAAVESQEHTKRAVVDGQIEDIEQTARVAGMVRQRLEERLGIPLRSVCVAAAGRVLKTWKTCYEAELDEREMITHQQVTELESHTIQQAYDELMASLGGSEAEGAFYCVGHTVTRYWLDDYEISTIVDHRGRRVRLEVIATFLPTEVVESLYATMTKIGLTISSVTLEPIAAMNAVIPRELRLLNIALVDIGAGTSDIAVSNNGSVVAYTMATVAGDEVTEQVMREFLVDFETAEQMKHQISGNRQEIEYTDILGFSYSVPPQEVLSRASSAIEGLGQEISQRILEINGGPPVAVFLVGGGSQTPELCRLVAQNLNIDSKKVAVGGSNYMKRMIRSEWELSGPEYATPMGIALTAMALQEHDSFTVTLNGQTVRMLKNTAMTTMEVLLMSGYQHSQIMGRSGRSVTFQLNGSRKVVRGGLPTVAVITVNGAVANITTPVHPGDELVFQPAVSGADAQPVVADMVRGGFEQFHVVFGGRRLPAGHVATINHKDAGPTDAIHNLDQVDIRQINTLAELCQNAGFDPAACQCTVGGRPVAGDYLLQPEDEIVCFALAAPQAAAAPQNAAAVPPAAASPAAPVQAQPAAPATPRTQPLATPAAVPQPPAPAKPAAVPQHAAVVPPAAASPAAPVQAAPVSQPQTVPAAPRMQPPVATAPAFQPQAAPIPPAAVAPQAPMAAFAPQTPAAPAQAVTIPPQTPAAPAAPAQAVPPVPAAPVASPQPQAAAAMPQMQPPAASVPSAAAAPQAPAMAAPATPQAPVAEPQPQAPAEPEPASGQESFAGLLHITLNESPLTLPPKADGLPYQFFDLLNFVEIDPSKPQGNIVQLLNGRHASYLEQLRDGDQVEIYWDRYSEHQP